MKPRHAGRVMMSGISATGANKPSWIKTVDIQTSGYSPDFGQIH
jgi:hypothetical protein